MTFTTQACGVALKQIPELISLDSAKMNEAPLIEDAGKPSNADSPARSENAGMDSADNSLVIPGNALRDPSLRKSDDEIINGVPLV
jgi:hypothetical protein